MPAHLNTWLTRTTGVSRPFIMGGMTFVGKAELVAAVANAGCLAFLTAFTQPSPDALRSEIRRCRQLATDKPFGINFTLLPSINPPDYAAYAQVAVDEGLRIFETAGNPKPVLPILLSAKDPVIIHKVISIRHALKAQQLGVSAVSIDGFECAGHPGEDDVTSLILMARAKQELKVPIIASGGYADGRAAAAAFALGAQGVNMGTRWMCTQEAPIHNNVKKAIVNAKETDTALLLKPLNNSVRCFSNSVAKAVLEEQNKSEFDFGKVAHLMTGKRGVQVYTEGDPDIGIWSLGQCAGVINDIPSCAELAARLERDTIAAIEEAYSLVQPGSSL